jgi:hypothetical protein
MDQITIKTSNPKCPLYWCLIEFIDWRVEIQSVMLVFSIGFVKHCHSNLLPVYDVQYMMFPVRMALAQNLISESFTTRYLSYRQNEENKTLSFFCIFYSEPLNSQ